MLQINIGGTKKWNLVDEAVREKWKVLDLAGTPDFHHDLNSGEPLPLDDNSVNAFYCSHTLEHVRHWLVVPLLRDMRRCLVPGGMIRIVVPDIERLIKIYQNTDDTTWRVRHNKTKKNEFYPCTPLGVLMSHFYSYAKGSKRDGHHMAFDWVTLRWCANEAGFSVIQQRNYNECKPVFIGLDFKRHAGKSLYLEATK
jgi:ubiquinone/menaquinone biosynthesis C-methylase UbiE